MDTEAGTFVVSLDGSKVKNVDWVSAGMYPDYDAESEDENPMKCGFNISCNTKSDTGVSIRTSICASKSPEGIESIAKGAKEIMPGVVENLVANGPLYLEKINPSDKVKAKIKKLIKGNR